MLVERSTCTPGRPIAGNALTPPEVWMTLEQLSTFALRHPVLCIIVPVLVLIQLALILVAFHTCSCEQCGRAFGIWRCRDRVLELCYGCYRERRPPGRLRTLVGSLTTGHGRKVNDGQDVIFPSAQRGINEAFQKAVRAIR